MKQFTLLLVVLCALGAQAAPDRTSRIINGQQASNRPSNALIVFTNEDGLGYFGGGTIISDRHILTSAWNIYGFVKWDVGVGSNILSQLGHVISEEAIAHPLYNHDNPANNIGIIILPAALLFTSDVAPVSLPAVDSGLDYYPFENEQGSIVGFGFTDVPGTVRPDYLMRAYQRVISNGRCPSEYQLTEPNQFCAEDVVEGANLCNGDLGAGFITDIHGRQTVTGVAAIITEHCGNSYPAGYTRVQPYLEWINLITDQTENLRENTLN